MPLYENVDYSVDSQNNYLFGASAVVTVESSVLSMAAAGLQIEFVLPVAAAAVEASAVVVADAHVAVSEPGLHKCADEASGVLVAHPNQLPAQMKTCHHWSALQSWTGRSSPELLVEFAWNASNVCQYLLDCQTFHGSLDCSC